MRLPDRALADATGELCAYYRSLLLDPSFRGNIEDVARIQTVNIDKLKSSWSEGNLPCHFDHAIALLAEGGVDGQAATEAVRSLQEALGPKSSVHWLKSPSGPGQVANHPKNGMEVSEFFRRLRAAQREVCEFQATLAEAALREERGVKVKRLTFAGIGLALVGLSAGGLALIAPAASVAIAGVGVGAATSEVFKALMSAIGNTMFQHYTAPRP